MGIVRQSWGSTDAFGLLFLSEASPRDSERGSILQAPRFGIADFTPPRSANAVPALPERAACNRFANCHPDAINESRPRARFGDKPPRNAACLPRCIAAW